MLRLSKTAFAALVSMIIFSIFAANVTKLLTHDLVYIQTERDLDGSKYTPMTTSLNNLIWFLQITDLHISVFRDPSRITELKEFCDHTVDVIKPVIVLASGDLTDAKTQDNIGSKQMKEEWEYYRDILQECNIEKKTLWLDIRGNHDNFNVVNLESRENYFPNYSVQGKTHQRSYMYQVRRNQEIYTFIGVDASLRTGPKRPFNFVGMLPKTEVELIDELVDKVKETKSNHTVWFGHYPTSCIVTEGNRNIRSIIGGLEQSVAYVCGHLHTLGGLVPNMYTLQKEGFLELELGDWKDNRRFRLMAIDHGMLSFTDNIHRDWPVILVTNPKSAQFLIPEREKFGTIINSTHIRILAFSISKIVSVKVRINDEHWRTCSLVHVNYPLFVSEWDTSAYRRGMHEIHVFVKDEDGRQKLIKDYFSLEHGANSFSVLARIALMTDASTVFKTMFAIGLVISVVPIALIRTMHNLVKGQKISKPTLRRGFFKRWFRKLWILSSIDRIFWPLFLYPLFLCIGPWSVGYIIEDHIGFIFARGIYINGTFLPGSFTYFYGFLQFVTFQIPMTFILASGAHYRYKELVLNSAKPTTCKKTLALHLPFAILLSLQVFMAYFFWLAYGTLAFLLGPLRTWSIILLIILWHQSLKYPEICVAGAASVWDQNRRAPINVAVLGQD